MNSADNMRLENKPLILIVDDILNNLQIIGNTLIDEGYEISMATGGAQALEMIETVLPDLILLDIMMPEMDGFEVCRKLKEDETTREIPVIFLTAKNETEDIIKGFEVGGIDYIVKPFNSAELLARVNTYLELKRSKELFNQINIKLRRLNEEKKQASLKLKEPADQLLTLLSDLGTNLDDFSRDDILNKINMARKFAHEINQQLDISVNAEN